MVCGSPWNVRFPRPRGECVLLAARLVVLVVARWRTCAVRSEWPVANRCRRVLDAGRPARVLDRMAGRRSPHRVGSPVVPPYCVRHAGHLRRSARLADADRVALADSVAVADRVADVAGFLELPCAPGWALLALCCASLQQCRVLRGCLQLLLRRGSCAARSRLLFR